MRTSRCVPRLTAASLIRASVRTRGTRAIAPAPARAFRHLLLAAAVCGANGDAVWAQLSPSETVEQMEVMVDLPCSVWATDPMVQNPTAVDIDSRGRIWITQGKNYRLFRNKQFQRIEGADEIRILEDTDQDGQADHFTVFADNIYPVPMGLAVQETYVDGVYRGARVFVGNSPDLLVLEDTDGDDRADKRYALLTGFGGIDSDHGVHGMTLALDGKLYFTQGDGMHGDPEKYRTRMTMDVTDRGGRRVRSDRRGATLRVNPDGTGLEVLGVRFRNNYEVAVDSFGRVFVSDNDDDGNRGCRTVWLMEGGNYGYRAPGSDHHWSEDLPGVIPKIVGTGNGSPGGILAYEGGLLGDAGRGAVLQIDAGTHAIYTNQLVRRGAAYRPRTSVLAHGTDAWFRPIDAAVAPDGAIYIVDWYDAGVGGHRFVDQSSGRVYRLDSSAASRKPPTADFRSVKGLIEALMNPNGCTRVTARHLLIAKADEAASSLFDLLQSGSPLMRARALHVLAGMEDHAARATAVALADQDPRIRECAIRLLARPRCRLELVETNDRGESDRLSDDVLHKILPLQDDADAGVRRELLLCLRYEPTDRVADALANLARQWDGRDRFYLEALHLALVDREPQFLARLFADATQTALRHVDRLYKNFTLPPYWPVATNDAYLRPSDQLPSENPASHLIGIVWSVGNPTATQYLDQLLDATDAPRVIRGVQIAVAQLAPDVAGTFAAKRFFQAAGAETKKSWLESIGQCSRRDAGHVADDPIVRSALDGALDDPPLQVSAVRLIGQLKVESYVDRLLAIAQDTNAGIEVRAAAIESLGQLQQQHLAEDFIRMIDDAQASRDASPLARAALRALASLSPKHAREQLTEVLLDDRHAAPLRREAIRQLAMLPGGGTQLVEMAKQNDVPDQLRSEWTTAVHRHPDRQVRRMAAELLPLPSTHGGRPLPPIRELLSRRGAPERGEAVFFRDGKDGTACWSCHRVQGRGRHVGPDLSTVGVKLGRDGLLESILNPSGAVSHGFQSVLLFLEDGRTLEGILTRETSDTTILTTATGQQLRVPKAHIAARRVADNSLMPEGLAQSMTTRDLVDLLAYLESLKQPVATASLYFLLGPFDGDAPRLPSDRDGLIDVTQPVRQKDRASADWQRRESDARGVLYLDDLFAASSGPAKPSNRKIYCYVPIQSPVAQTGRAIVSTQLHAAVSCNGHLVSDSPTDSPAPHDIDVMLAKGGNHLLIELSGHAVPAELSTAIVTEAAVRLDPLGMENPSGQHRPPAAP